MDKIEYTKTVIEKVKEAARLGYDFQDSVNGALTEELHKLLTRIEALEAKAAQGVRQ